jgi:outer membrane protein TolC
VLGHLGRWADLGIPAELRRAYEEAVRAGKDVERGSEAVGKAKKWMVQAAADYSVGLLDVRETFDAVEAYVSLRTAVMKARYDYNVAMAALSVATGTLDGDSDILYLTRPETPHERTAR